MKTQLNLNIITTFVCFCFLSLATAQAQVITKDAATKTLLVKGNVSDDAAPLPGVNIILKGTRIGTSTDFNGDFQFPKQLKKGDILLFSYIGFKTQSVVIDDATSASRIELKIDMLMDDIVIIGAAGSKAVFKSQRK